MSHAFLSYVREDGRVVEHVKRVLEANGIQCWMDKSDLKPGLAWRDQLRKAVQTGTFFVPFFSPSWAAKVSTTANEEVLWAIDELRRRPQDQAWFISFVLPGGRVPEYSLGADRYLTDLQYLSVDALGWKEATRRLLKACGVEAPVLDAGEPLALGFPSQASVTGGRYTVDEIHPRIDALENIDFPIESGSIWRDEIGIIHAEMIARAPNTAMHATNQLLGLDRMVCQTSEPMVSRDQDNPTSFTSQRHHVIPRGSNIPSMFGQPAVRVPYDMRADITYSATGYLSDTDRFQGAYAATLIVGPLKVKLEGQFDVGLQPSFDPTLLGG